MASRGEASGLVDRQVGDDQTDRTRSGHGRCVGVDAPGEDRIGVRHDEHGKPRSVHDVADDRRCCGRTWPPHRVPCRPAVWIVGPSMSGSEYGIPISNPSAPASAMATNKSADEAGSGSPRSGTAARARDPRHGPRRMLRRPGRGRQSSRAAICWTSLSPRPDRLSTTVLAGEPVGTRARPMRAHEQIRAPG